MENYLIMFTALIAFIVIGSVAKSLYKTYSHVWTIWDYQVGLHYQHGVYVEKLNAGKHRFWGSGHHVFHYDTRIQEKTVQGQEVITADCATLKLTAVGQWRIVAAEKFHLGADDSDKALHTVIQFALRQVVGSLSIDDIIEKKTGFAEELLKLMPAQLQDLGIEMIRIDVRDVMLSSELKSSYQGIITAKKASLVKLEQARGEAAALRSLANTAKLFEKNPELMQIKYLETLKEAGTSGYGNTLVIGVPEEMSGLIKK